MLCGFGAHFTLSAPDTPKRPIGKHWQKHRPSSAKIINWIREGGAIGLIPASVDSVVLDCDKGNPESLAREFPPYCQYQSRTPGHHHLWYQSNQPVQLYLWSYQGCSGEVISSNRHISLPTPQHLSTIYQGMIDNPITPFPLTSILTPPMPPLSSDKSQDSVTSDSFITHIQDTYSPHNPPITPLNLIGSSHPYAPNLIGKVDTHRVDSASIGERNISLFEDLRKWAYQQPQGQDYRVWEWTVAEHAAELREHLPSLWDFGIPEALATAKSVAQWTWEHTGAGVSHSHDTERQRKRGYLSGKRRRQRAHNRDTEIVVWRGKGKSWREISELMKMPESTIRSAYSRKVRESSNG